jgi:hypothetical protein
MDNRELFEKLLHAETEEAVDAILANAGYLKDDEEFWVPLGGIENNFAAVGNQQGDPVAAFLEKPINGIDAVLTAACYAAGIDPKGPDAPRTMSEAVERFFDVPGGQVGSLTPARQRELAENVYVVAVGSKTHPNYLIVDRGEGQTPAMFPDTFLSLLRSNKLTIPFVQGKFNSGGTGVLQFCGMKNYQLIASRRHPACFVDSDDETSELWGFTIVRRMWPSAGRRSSMYVYLAPGGRVPSFAADAIMVLPGEGRRPRAYDAGLPYGTCIKLYDYRWKAKSTFTLDGRWALERQLHVAALPFRLTETREYNPNYFSTTVAGSWVTNVGDSGDGDRPKLEDGFPASAELVLPDIGQLPYEIAVFKPEADKRRVPRGVSFVLNGQVHGGLRSDFVTRRLKLDYLKDDYGALAVSVDCSSMEPTVREDFLMASRDRVRENETFEAIEAALAKDLRGHPGLQELNQERRKRSLERAVSDETHRDVLQEILASDPSFAALFDLGDRLITTTGPGPRPPFVGKPFPSFFQLAKEPSGGLVKRCPIDQTVRVEFLTDAVNDYFTRASNPGQILFDPPTLLEHSHLWNGRFETRFRVPWDAQPGDRIVVTVTVTDLEREALASPFVMNFTLEAVPEVGELSPKPGGPKGPRKPNNGGTPERPALTLPEVVEVAREQWEDYNPPFTEYESIRIQHSGDQGYDFFVNVSSAFLLTEFGKTKDEERLLIKYWFTYGLVFAALGMLRHCQRLASQPSAVDGSFSSRDEVDDEADELDSVVQACDGLAQVIVPIIRTLHTVPSK